MSSDVNFSGNSDSNEEVSKEAWLSSIESYLNNQHAIAAVKPEDGVEKFGHNWRTGFNTVLLEGLSSRNAGEIEAELLILDCIERQRNLVHSRISQISPNHELFRRCTFHAERYNHKDLAIKKLDAQAQDTISLIQFMLSSLTGILENDSSWREIGRLSICEIKRLGSLLQCSEERCQELERNLLDFKRRPALYKKPGSFGDKDSKSEPEATQRELSQFTAANKNLKNKNANVLSERHDSEHGAKNEAAAWEFERKKLMEWAEQLKSQSSSLQEDSEIVYVRLAQSQISTETSAASGTNVDMIGRERGSFNVGTQWKFLVRESRGLESQLSGNSKYPSINDDQARICDIGVGAALQVPNTAETIYFSENRELEHKLSIENAKLKCVIRGIRTLFADFRLRCYYSVRKYFLSWNHFLVECMTMRFREKCTFRIANQKRNMLFAFYFSKLRKHSAERKYLRRRQHSALKKQVVEIRRHYFNQWLFHARIYSQRFQHAAKTSSNKTKILLCRYFMLWQNFLAKLAHFNFHGIVSRSTTWNRNLALLVYVKWKCFLLHQLAIKDTVHHSVIIFIVKLKSSVFHRWHSSAQYSQRMELLSDRRSKSLSLQHRFVINAWFSWKFWSFHRTTQNSQQVEKRKILKQKWFHSWKSFADQAFSMEILIAHCFTTAKKLLSKLVLHCWKKFWQHQHRFQNFLKKFWVVRFFSTIQHHETKKLHSLMLKMFYSWNSTAVSRRLHCTTAKRLCLVLVKRVKSRTLLRWQNQSYRTRLMSHFQKCSMSSLRCLTVSRLFDSWKKVQHHLEALKMLESRLQQGLQTLQRTSWVAWSKWKTKQEACKIVLTHQFIRQKKALTTKQFDTWRFFIFRQRRVKKRLARYLQRRNCLSKVAFQNWKYHSIAIARRIQIAENLIARIFRSLLRRFLYNWQIATRKISRMKTRAHELCTYVKLRLLEAVCYAWKDGLNRSKLLRDNVDLCSLTALTRRQSAVFNTWLLSQRQNYAGRSMKESADSNQLGDYWLSWSCLVDRMKQFETDGVHDVSENGMVAFRNAAHEMNPRKIEVIWRKGLRRPFSASKILSGHINGTYACSTDYLKNSDLHNRKHSVHDFWHAWHGVVRAFHKMRQRLIALQASRRQIAIKICFETWLLFQRIARLFERRFHNKVTSVKNQCLRIFSKLFSTFSIWKNIVCINIRFQILLPGRMHKTLYRIGCTSFRNWEKRTCFKRRCRTKWNIQSDMNVRLKFGHLCAWKGLFQLSKGFQELRVNSLGKRLTGALLKWKALKDDSKLKAH